MACREALSAFGVVGDSVSQRAPALRYLVEIVRRLEASGREVRLDVV